MNFSRIIAITWKEWLHIIRDKRTLFVAIVMPIFMLLLYGYAIEMELKQISIGILDFDQSHKSKNVIEHILADKTFHKTATLHYEKDIHHGFQKQQFRVAIIFPKGFAEQIHQKDSPKVQIITDGSDVNSAAIISNSISMILQQVSLEQIHNHTGKSLSLPITIRTQIWFNNELRSPVFIVPGLIALFLVMVCAILTSVAIAREKEFGTLEQLLITPVRVQEVLIGKLMPYVLIAAIDTLIIIMIGKYLFQVPIHGNLLALSLYCLLYLLVALGMGLMISVMVKTQQLALMLALVVTLLPSLLLSGLIFPVASMPKVLQIVTYIIPARWFIEIVRGVMLKGVNYFPLQSLVLLLMAMILLTLSIRIFKKQVLKGNISV